MVGWRFLEGHLWLTGDHINRLNNYYTVGWVLAGEPATGVDLAVS